MNFRRLSPPCLVILNTVVYLVEKALCQYQSITSSTKNSLYYLRNQLSLDETPIFSVIPLFVSPDDSSCLLLSASATFGPTLKLESAMKLLRAGPRKFLFFEPKEVKACIVTCGGLCPGMNTVIRELVRTLKINYSVPVVYGIKYGYKGFYTYEWQELEVEKVRPIHKYGGTILGSSRGGFDLEKIMEKIIEKGINQVCLFFAY